jgi:hypothetical protein
MDEQCLRPFGTRSRKCGADLIRLPSDEKLDLQTEACGLTLDRAVLLSYKRGDCLDPGQGVL